MIKLSTQAGPSAVRAPHPGPAGPGPGRAALTSTGQVQSQCRAESPACSTRPGRIAGVQHPARGPQYGAATLRVRLAAAIATILGK
jgi:hypothetical protein